MSRAAYSAEHEKIEAGYKVAKGNCTAMSGNAKDVCQAEAKADATIGQADLEAKYAKHFQ